MMLWRAIVLSLGLLLTACHADSLSQAQPMIRVGLAQLPMTMDPRYATDAASMRVQELVHRGLIRLDEHFMAEPDLALHWQHPDALTWVFTLRGDVSFHDGSQVSAQDVAATLEAVIDPDLASPLQAGFSAIQSLEAPDKTHLIIHLSRPDASLLTRLNLGVLPAAWAKKAHSPKETMGCGPYRLVKFAAQKLDLQPVAAHQGLPIRMIEAKNPVTRSLKLVRGEIDFAQNDLPPHLLPYLQQQAGLQVQTRPSTTFTYIGMNLQDAVLKDLRVRKALAMALDRKALKKALYADAPELAETVLIPSHWAATELAETPFDPQQAIRLLDQAGYPPDQHGVRMHLNYRTSTDPVRLRLVTAIAAQWENIGVHVSIESLEWGGFYARIKQGDFQLFSLSWVGISDPDIYRWILHSSMWPPKGANRGRYSNAEVDAELDAAAGSEDMQQRRSLYARIEKQMQADQVYIPLWYDAVVAVSTRKLHGFKLVANGSLLGLKSATMQP